MATDPTTDTQPLLPLRRHPHDAAGGPAWVTLARPGAVEETAPVPLRRVVTQVVAGVVVVLLVVAVAGALAARRLAEREAVNDAAAFADVLAEAVVQPALTDALLGGDATARADFDEVVRDQVLGTSVVHVKLWLPDGTVAYADEPGLVGRTFDLDAEQREALAEPTTRAEISDLDREENQLDRTSGDKLVEVYRPVWTPGGGTALFEIYAPYDAVSARTGQLWRGFAGVTATSLLLFLVLLVPLLTHLTTRVRRDQRQRELLLQRAVDASTLERRRIAGSLHDGPVQDLAAASFVVSAAASRARATGQHALVGELQEVAASVRTSIRVLRSLLVDIYPASLTRAGLGEALADVVHSARTPAVEIRLHADPDEQLGLDPAQERLVFRVVQETVRNAVRHAAPCAVTVTLLRLGEDVVLDVVDDGDGFDVPAVLADPEHGHLGLRLLVDAAEDGGGLLEVSSGPGLGTHWRLTLTPPG